MLLATKKKKKKKQEHGPCYFQVVVTPARLTVTQRHSMWLSPIYLQANQAVLVKLQPQLSLKSNTRMHFAASCFYIQALSPWSSETRVCARSLGDCVWATCSFINHQVIRWRLGGRGLASLKHLKQRYVHTSHTHWAALIIKTCSGLSSHTT